MSILEIRARTKEWIEVNKRTLAFGLLSFLISSISFASGYLAAGELRHPQIVIEQNKAVAASLPTPVIATASIIDSVIDIGAPARLVSRDIDSRSRENKAGPVAVAVASTTLTSVAVEMVSTSTPAQVCTYQTKMFPNFHNLIFNEIAWMGSKEDSSAEWIELKNISEESVELAGYQLIDRAEQIKITLPQHTLEPGAFYVLGRGEDDASALTADLFYTGALSNTNEGLRLFDPYCFLVDQVEASPQWPGGDAKTKKSMERGWALEWYTYASTTTATILGTPGKPNTAPNAPQSQVTQLAAASPAPAATPSPSSTATSTEVNPVPEPVATVPITITEVLAGTEAGADDEFIELYNPNTVAVDLTGYSIKKRTSSGSESTFVSASRLDGKSIPAGKYFLIVHDQGYQGSVASDATWAKSNSLAYTNNAVVLYEATGAKIAEVAWADLQKGVSTTGTPSPQNSSQ